MGKDKLRKFSEIGTFQNVRQLDEGKILKGKWAKEQFGNNKPIVLELACGKGEYTLNLAKQFPDKNFIGVDFKGNRIWRGAKTALEEGISNVGFLRIQIEAIQEYFDKGEVSEIWITFPDPQPQKSRIKKRLTHESFLAKYDEICSDGAILNLKTDNNDFFEYTLEVLDKTNAPVQFKTEDLYNSKYVDEILSIKTYYERKYLQINKNINFVRWKKDKLFSL